MPEPFDDPAHLTFRSGARANTARQGSQGAWIVVTLVGVVLFVLVLRALLERTSGTIGGSVTKASVEASELAPSYDEGSYNSPEERTPDEEGFYPATGMVYRCEGKGGEVSFQSQPCGPAARTTKAIHAPPDRVRPRRVASAAIAPSANASVAQYARVSQSDPVRNNSDAACAQAKRSREETLERVGLSRTYELLQRLDAMVNEACR